MKSSLKEEIVFKYIVKGLIDIGKSREEIIKILEINGLCNKTKMQKYDSLIKKYLHYSCNSQGEYIHQENALVNEEMHCVTKENLRKKAGPKDKEHNDEYIPFNNILHCIRNSYDGRISYIEELKLACTLSDDYERIEVSPNDAATLLKNIACIESKLNQIVRSVNIIATALGIARDKMDK